MCSKFKTKGEFLTYQPYLHDVLQIQDKFSGELVESEFGEQCVTCAGVFFWY